MSILFHFMCLVTQYRHGVAVRPVGRTKKDTTGRRPRRRPNVVTELGARCGDIEASLSLTGEKYFHYAHPTPNALRSLMPLWFQLTV